MLYILHTLSPPPPNGPRDLFEFRAATPQKEARNEPASFHDRRLSVTCGYIGRVRSGKHNTAGGHRHIGSGHAYYHFPDGNAGAANSDTHSPYAHADTSDPNPDANTSIASRLDVLHEC